MKLENYKIVDDSILISKDEIIRMINESYKWALEYFNEYMLTKKSELSAASLKCEGCAHTWEHILEKFENDDIG
jgi:hypothetical protein